MLLRFSSKIRSLSFFVIMFVAFFLFLLPTVSSLNDFLCLQVHDKLVSKQVIPLVKDGVEGGRFYSENLIGEGFLEGDSSNLPSKLPSDDISKKINSIKEKIEKKREDLNELSINKTLPKVVSQRDLSKDNILEKLEKESGFKKAYEHAKGLGYAKMNTKSEEVTYDDGTIATFTELYGELDSEILNEKLTFLVNVKNIESPQNRNFLMELEKINETITLKIFDESNGVIVDLSDYSIISEWGHHSCSWGNCVGFGIEWILLSNPGTICTELCTQICISNFNALGCAPCLVCIAGGFFAIEETCLIDSCYFYPCLDDCNDYDGYGSFQNYCVGNSVYKHRLFYNSYCPTSNPREGSCSLDASYTDDTFVQSCSYGCSNGACLDPIQCYQDIECGEDRWTGSKFCQSGNVYQNRITNDCVNGGTTSAYCTQNVIEQLREDCGGSGCSNGECVTPPSCTGDNEYLCNGQCYTFCGAGEVLCCPSSGTPTQCYDESTSVCKSDGGVCSPVLESCNNKDDNCDNIVDSFQENCGLGICANGTRTCTTGSWGSCSTSNLATTETCNNLDDDCDGSIDESLSQACGTDVGECVAGTQTCSTGVWGSCGGAYIGPAEEICDVLDNNCNGVIDENDVCGNFPNGTLVSPPNYNISFTGNINFNCSAKDNSGLANITLYHSISGNMTPNVTKIITGKSNSTNWTINNIPDGTNFMWNCQIYDNDTNWAWASNITYNVNVTIDTDPPEIFIEYPPNNTVNTTNNNITFLYNVTDVRSSIANCSLYTNNILKQTNSSVQEGIAGQKFDLYLINGNYNWSIQCQDTAPQKNLGIASGSNLTVNVPDTKPPEVNLTFPSNGTVFGNTIDGVIFNISVIDEVALANCTIYTNITGTWKANSTNMVTGTSNKTSFTIDNIANGGYIWNVLCYDNKSNSAWAPYNWSFTINFTGESVCQELNTLNTIYKLNNSIQTSGTCFTVTANNVTIDGQGYTIVGDYTGKGIDIASKDKIIIRNITIGNFDYGIDFVSVPNYPLKIYDVTSIGNDFDGIRIQQSDNHVLQNINSSYNKRRGIYLFDVNIANLTNIEASNNFDNGIHTFSSPNLFLGEFTAIIMINITTNNHIDNSGVYIDNANNTLINNLVSNYNTGGYGLFLYKSSHTNVTNMIALQGTGMKISSGGRENLIRNGNVSSVNLDLSSTNNLFLNTTYPTENVAAGSELLRKWYLDVRVDDTNGHLVSQANVTAWNLYNAVTFSELTNSSGTIAKKELVEYTNNGGTKTYATPHTVNVTRTGYTTNSTQINLTMIQNKFHYATLFTSEPTINSLTLNSSFGTNLSSENLTVYSTTSDPDGDNVKRIYNWYKNNESLASLYLAFEGKSNSTFTKDYSNRGNANVIGAVWDPDGGYDGFGAYVFNDQDERIVVSDSNSADMNDDFTILSWIYPKTTTYAIAMKGELATVEDYRFYSWSDFLRFRWGNGSVVGEASCQACTKATNQWLFVGVVYRCNTSGSSVDFYINGAYNSTATSNTTCVKGGTSDLWIGSRQNLAYTLNGTIDELRIYNYSLSANQIKAIYDNKTNLIVSDETNPNEIYKVEVTPYDGKGDGNSTNSTNLLVLDSIATINCGTLDRADTLYKLQNDISTTSTCFTITADGVTLDGQGFNVDGDDSFGSVSGVDVSGRNNITIKNLNITDFMGGVYLVDTNNSLVFNNSITSGSQSIIVQRGYFNRIINNTASHNHLFDDEIGIIIKTGSYNNITGNTAEWNTFYGIATVLSSDNNIIKNNTANYNNQSGVLIEEGTDNKVIDLSANSNLLCGIQVGSATSNVVIESPIIIGSDGICYQTVQGQASVSEAKITNTDITKHDLRINNSAAGTINLTDLVHVGNYSFTGEGGAVIFKDTEFGDINFFNGISGSAANLTKDVQITNNSVLINIASNPGLDKLANVTLYGIGNRGFSIPTILRNGVLCSTITNPSCSNFTALNVDTIKFNMTTWSTYSIGERPIVSFVNPTPANGSSQSNNNIYVNLSSNYIGDHYSFIDFDRDLLLWMRMDDTNNSGSPIDISSYGNNGSLINDSYIDFVGKFGKAVHLDGTNDYVDVPNTQILNFTPYGNKITVSVWVKLTSDPNDYRGVVVKGINDAPEGGGSKGFEIIYRATPVGYRWMLGSKVVGFNYTAISTGSLTVTNWNHIVGTYNGSTAKIYLNGVEKASSNVGIDNFDTTNPLKIGKFGSSKWTNGTIDDVLIFNRSLSAAEISSLYNASATQYEHNFTGLSTGSHTFRGHAINISGNKAQTELRSVTIQ